MRTSFIKDFFLEFWSLKVFQFDTYFLRLKHDIYKMGKKGSLYHLLVKYVAVQKRSHDTETALSILYINQQLLRNSSEE